MVGKTLPLPILKYLEMTPENVNRILLEYPFYLLPRISQILNENKLQGTNLSELNFFGLHKDKLDQYATIFQPQRIEPMVQHNEVIGIVTVNCEPETSFRHIEIDMSDTLADHAEARVNNLAEETSDAFIEEVETLNEKDQFAITVSHQKENCQEEKGNTDENKKDSNNLMISDLQLQEAKNKSEMPPINANEIGIKEPIIIEFSDSNSSNIEYSDIKSIDLEFELEVDKQLEVNKATQDKLDDELLKEGVKEAAERSNIDFDIEFNNHPEDRTSLDIEVIFEDSSENHINQSPEENTGFLEVPILADDLVLLSDSPDDSLVDFQNLREKEKRNEERDPPLMTKNLEIVSESKIEATPSFLENNDSKDFVEWLANFSSYTNDSSQKEENDKNNKQSIDDHDQFSIEMLAHASRQNIISDLEPQKEDPRVNKDDELEGVMQDNFFRNQVEIKKANRKTPSEMRIQDEAQLSLQPIDLISETMAILYEKQGNRSKAIEIYEKLIARIPEKSSFFALQIEKLRR